MNVIPEKWRNITLDKGWAWISSVFILACTGWTIFGALITWIVQASANDIFDGMLQARGITQQSFKELQKDTEELQQDVGSIKGSIGNINNTLTMNAFKQEAEDADRKEIKEQVQKLVDKLIQE